MNRKILALASLLVVATMAGVAFLVGNATPADVASDSLGDRRDA